MMNAQSSTEPIDMLAYEQATRALDQQAGVLDELRQRTSTLIAVTALVATFLGGGALAAPATQQGPRGLLLLAFLALLIGLGLAVGILIPTRSRKRTVRKQPKTAPSADDVVALAFSMNVEVLLDRAEKAGPVEMTARLDVARTLQLAWNENSPIIAAKQRLFTLAGVALLTQAAAWIGYIALGKEVI